MPRTVKRAVMVVTTLFLLAVAALVAAQPASAGSTCAVPLCSQTVNDNAKGVPGFIVQRDWCGNDANTREVEDMRCPTSSQRRLLSSGESTAWDQDWDAVKFPAGCYGYFHAANWTGGADRNYPVDRRSPKRTTLWFRVHNNEVAHVTMRCS